MATNTHTQGTVKDPEHDGRLKENREAGRTKETTPGSKARAESGGKAGEHHETKASHDSTASQSKSHATETKSSGADDLKSREYMDKDGNVHHHTRSNNG